MAPGYTWLAAAFALSLAACSSTPVRTGQSAGSVPSPNFDERRPGYVILHHTSTDSMARAIRILTDPATRVSAHYLIGRDGRQVQLVDERSRAWHAGDSRWGGNADINSSSIGIELDNSGFEPFPEPQIRTLLALLSELRERYRIPTSNYLGHGDVAPGRKVDPSRFFPWKLLAEQGFGLWCDTPAAAAPAGFDATLGLQAFGYDASDPAAAAAAFRRRFRGEDRPGGLDDVERSVLACLLELKRR